MMLKKFRCRLPFGGYWVRDFENVAFQVAGPGFWEATGYKVFVPDMVSESAEPSTTMQV
jgi:hypothetical protein